MCVHRIRRDAYAAHLSRGSRSCASIWFHPSVSQSVQFSSVLFVFYIPCGQVQPLDVASRGLEAQECGCWSRQCHANLVSRLLSDMQQILRKGGKGSNQSLIAKQCLSRNNFGDMRWLGSWCFIDVTNRCRTRRLVVGCGPSVLLVLRFGIKRPRRLA